MQQPTKPDQMTKNYMTGRDDETQCINETSDTMASCNDETFEGKQGRDAAQRCNNQPNKAGVMRCAWGCNAMTRQDETRQRDNETMCHDDAT
jgi:hypothetical protein